MKPDYSEPSAQLYADTSTPALPKSEMILDMRRAALVVEGFRGSGADVLEELKPFIEGKTIICINQVLLAGMLAKRTS